MNFGRLRIHAGRELLEATYLGRWRQLVAIGRQKFASELYLLWTKHGLQADSGSQLDLCDRVPNSLLKLLGGQAR